MLNKILTFLRSVTSKDYEVRDVNAMLSRAVDLHHQGAQLEAAECCHQILNLRPGHLPTMQLLAEIAIQRNVPDEAIAWYSKVVSIDPRDAGAFYKRGNLHKARNQLDAALFDYEAAIAINPGFSKALCNRGVVLENLGRLESARDSYYRAIISNADDALSHYNLAGVLRQLQQPQQALASYDRAITINPDYCDALINRGLLLAKLRLWDDAMASYELVIEVSPSSFMAYYYRGALLHERRQWGAALASYNQALQLNPAHPESYSSRGILFAALRRWDEARADLNHAIILNPELPEAHFGLGNLHSELKQMPSAIQHFDRAIALKPGYVDALHNRGNAYLNVKRFDAAIADYQQVFAINPDYRFLLGTRLHAEMNLCDWSNLDSGIEQLIGGLERCEAISPPFPVLTLIDRENLQLNAAQVWASEKFPEDGSLPKITRRPRHSKIRLGYFSADFHEHPVAVLTAQLFENHDRTRFEVIGFSFGPLLRDPMRARLERGFDRFIDVSGKSDEQIASLARSLDVDIAIDLMGFTANHRTGIFALRAAPIQISYLGYPGTMGADYVDYLVGDVTVIPQDASRSYTEKIIYLQGSYLPNDTTRRVSEASHTREELGLPHVGFVFCCFNNNYKITPKIFDSWMRILTRVEGSVLWLAHNSAIAAQNLREQAVQRGVNERRLVFSKHIASAADHLARHEAADLFLDTLPYNAHATAIDALWAGLPVLTCVGKSFAGRVGASLLRAIDLPELVVATMEEYEELAVQLASHRERYTAIRKKLSNNRLACRLFDPDAFVRQLEQGFIQAYERHQTGLAPDHIY